MAARPQLNGATRRQLVALFGDSNDRREVRLLPQLPQQVQPLCLGILRAVPEVGSQHQDITIAARQLPAPTLEVGELQNSDRRLRTENAQMMFEPLSVTSVLVNHEQPCWHRLGHYLPNANFIRKRAR